MRIAHAAVVDGVIAAVVYADLFDYPLTHHEVHRYLPVPAGLDVVRAVLVDLVARGQLMCVDGFYTLPARGVLASTRVRRSLVAKELWAKATPWIRRVARLPFVRMVAVTGSLAAGNPAAGADVDLMIVTSDGRLWSARAATIGLVRLAASRGVVLCPNYLLAESALEIADRDLFTARELLQAVPVAGFRTYRRLMERNAWCRSHFPNALPETVGDEPRGDSRGFKVAAESVLRLRVFDALERMEMDRAVARISMGQSLTEANLGEQVCKGHFGGHRERTLARYEASLQRVQGGSG